MAKRRRWEDELEERERAAKPQLSQLDEGKRAGVLEELQRAGGNRALQQVVGGQQLQREAAPARSFGGRTYMTVDGIKGPEMRKSFEGQFEVDSWNYEATSPRDPATGQARGERRHSEVVVVVQKSGATTRFRQALATNEIIKTVAIDDGIERMTMSNVSVVGIKEAGTGKVQLRFVFQKVIFSSEGVEAEDDWAAQK
jgi:type VI protein secretion system component Hcp